LASVDRHLPLHFDDGVTTLLLQSGTGRLPLRTSVDVLHCHRRRSWGQLPHVGPLFVGVGARRHAKIRRTFGAAPKISGTGRFQGQERKPWQKQRPPGVPLQRRPQAPEARRPDQKSQTCLILEPTYPSMRTRSRRRSSRHRHWSGPANVPDGQVSPLRGP
jgi:hypothetical protein